MPAQSPFSSSTTRILILDLSIRLHICFQRQPHAQQGASGWIIGRKNCSAMGGDDLLGNPEAQPVAFGFGGEIWIENGIELSRRHPRPSVADLNQNRFG